MLDGYFADLKFAIFGTTQRTLSVCVCVTPPKGFAFDAERIGHTVWMAGCGFGANHIRESSEEVSRWDLRFFKVVGDQDKDLFDPRLSHSSKDVGGGIIYENFTTHPNFAT